MCMQMLKEISKVLSAIREVVKRNNSFSRALPYTISDKCSRLSSAVPSLHKRDEEEDNKIIAFLDHVRQGETDFWEPKHSILIRFGAVENSRLEGLLLHSSFFCS
jgi:hypothetical protein